MKPQDDELRRLRDQLSLHIDAAAKAVAEALQVAADLLLAMALREPISEPAVERAETSSMPEMMTPKQAAEYLGIAAQTLAVWRSTGRYALPFVKVGRNVRYRRSDLDKFFQRQAHRRGREVDSP